MNLSQPSKLNLTEVLLMAKALSPVQLMDAFPETSDTLDLIFGLEITSRRGVWTSGREPVQVKPGGLDKPVVSC